ncbi:adenylate cyclase [Salmonella enterica subsp. enterica serovar Saintpaul]|nr:adenylate cyclase [Salmonella enterica subsp. enterica serovar Saintpaul]
MKIGFNFSVVSPCLYSQESIKNNNNANFDDERKALADSIKEKTGIVHKHLLSLQQLANEINCIISIRPVDKLATDLIESGYPTKGFHIKGKSASWGPQAGFICVEQCYSKLENSPIERIDKFNQQVQQCIIDGHAASVALTVTQKRLYTLLENGIIEDLSFRNINGVCSFKAQGPSGQYYFFEATKSSHSDADIYFISHHNKPINVLAPTENALAFTADYDLLMIAPHISDYGVQDNLPVPDVSHEEFCHRLDLYKKNLPISNELMRDYSNPAGFYKKEDPDIGNASERTRQLIDIINNKLVGEGERVIHHNVDCSSPATDLSANYPATFALPKKIGRFDSLSVIENSEELKELIIAAKDSGYCVKTNPLWGEDFRNLKSHNFNDAREQLMRKFKLTS